MHTAETLASLDLPAAILALDEMEREGRREAVPVLLEVFRSAGAHEVVRRAAGDTLRVLLPGDEDDLAAGLGSEDPAVRRLCAQVAAAHPTAALAPLLADLGGREPDPDLLAQVLSALAPHPTPEALAVFRRHATHEDPVVAALAIEALAARRDSGSFPLLRSLVEASDADGTYDVCTVITQKAVEALGALEDEQSLAFLVSKLHHRNPTARRLVHEAIVRRGAAALPHLAAALEDGTADERILAANVLGLIGSREAGNLLVAAFDRGRAGDANVRFALYEALGLAPTLKGVVVLADGLAEEDDTTLLAVVSGLERQRNPGVVARVRAALDPASPSRDRVARAVVGSRSLGLFESLYADPSAAEALLQAAEALGDSEATEALRERLRELGSGRALADAARLDALPRAQPARRLLAVDDSKSMLLFYRGIGTSLGLDVATAANGREALDLVEAGETFEAVVTDLNMPVMDGLELTRRLRANFFTSATPVLMATTESEASQRELALQAGVNGFLNKPLRPEVLAEALRRIL